MANFYAEYPGSSGGGSGVSSLNSLTGALSLVAGTGISITPVGSNITIASTVASSGAAGLVQFSDGVGGFDSDSTFFFDIGTGSLGIGTNSPNVSLHIMGAVQSDLSVTDIGASSFIFEVDSDTTVDGSNTTIGINGVADATVQLGATNDKTLAGLNLVMTRGDGTDEGVLHEVDGVQSLLTINSDTAGLTDQAFGFSNISFSQKGTLTNLYDFFSQRVPSGPGVFTNHYGIYISADSVTPVKNWLSGRTKIGDSSATLSSISAGLEIGGTTSALLLSRMDTAARDALTAVNGMEIYNSDDDEFQAYQAGAWVPMISGSGGANTALSNLTSPTAINQDLLPVSDLGYNLGTLGFAWSSVVVANVNDNVNVTALDANGRRLLNTAGESKLAYESADVTLQSGLNGTSSSGNVNINTPNSTSTTGGIFMNTGVSATADSGEFFFYTQNVPGNSGPIAFQTGTAGQDTGGGPGPGTSGPFQVNTGSCDGSGKTGNIDLATGGANTGDSGDITLLTGFSAVNRGVVSIDALALNAPRHAADPVGAGITGGSIYYNTSINKLKMYNGSTWETITSA